jgi:DNA processing protein
VPGERVASAPLPVDGWPPGYADGEENRRALLVLTALRGIEAQGLLALAGQEGSAAASLARIRAGGAGSEADRLYARTLDPDALARRADQVGARFVPVGSPGYPAQLEHLRDPPPALFVRGRPPPDVASAVGVVGSRRCTDVGRELAHDIGRGLALAGVSVVSGAARGIDAASHEGALSAGGHTVAVMACGIDEVYPPGSRSLVARILETGTVVTEYAPGVPAEAFRFPTRNRIVAALGRAVVVVEGAERSGTLSSARHALEVGREVFAVPGSVTTATSFTPNALIRDGATLIRGVDDLLADLGLGVAHAQRALPVDLAVAERAAFDSVIGAVLPERVARDLGVAIPDALGLLMRLEMRGLVRSVGGRFERRLADAGPQPEPASPT